MTLFASDAGATSSRRSARASVPRLSIDDVAQLIPLFAQYRACFGAPTDSAAANNYVRDRIASGESVVLGAVVQGAEGPELVGFAQLYPSFSSMALGRILALNDPFVSPSWRRSGIGRLLLAAALDTAIARDALRIELATQHTNEQALALYRSVGFVIDMEFAHLTRALSGGST